jgi:DNA-binding MarR family transcriptional regulator
MMNDPGKKADSAATQDIDELVTAVLTASRVLVAVAARSLSEHNETVTITQYRTLVVIDNHPNMNQNRLADHLGVNASTATRMIDRLVAADLVRRLANPGDRRATLLDLTREGRKIVSTVTQRRRAEINRIITAMPPNRRYELIDALHAFADAAGEPAPLDTALDW